MRTISRSSCLSLLCAVGAHTTALAGEPAPSSRTPDAYKLEIPEESTLITANELKQICGGLNGWVESTDILQAPQGFICGVDSSIWADPKLAGNDKTNFVTERNALFKRLIATCSLRSIGPTQVIHWTDARATFDELKAAASGECSVQLNTVKADDPAIVALGAGAHAAGGGAFMSDLLWATTGVVVDRAIETVELWSLQRSLGKMCQVKEDAPEFRLASLTPDTCDVVLGGVASADIAGFGARLKTAATADALTFPRHLATELLYLGWYEDGEETTPDVTQDLLLSTALGASMMELIVEGQHPIGALGAWAQGGQNIKGFDASWTEQPMTTGLYFASFLVANLDLGEVWINDDGLLALRNALKIENNQSDLSVTMLYNSTKSHLPDGWIRRFGEKIVPATSGDLPVNLNSTDLQHLYRAAQHLLESGHELQVAWMITRSAQSGVPIANHSGVAPTQAQAWRSLASATSNLLAAILDSLDIAYPGDRAPQKSAPVGWLGTDLMKQVRLPLTNLSAMLGAVGASDRTAATLKGIELSLNILSVATTTITSGIELQGRAAKNEDIDRVAALRSVTQEAGDAATLVGGLYAAQSTEEMEAVLSAYIAPPGSYVEKRNKPAPWYVSMNGYVGLGSGVEILRVPQTDDEGTVTQVNDPSFAFWPVVALGPEIGLRVCDGCDHPTNFGFFVPLVDLGTLAQYRIENSETTSFPEVAINDVFAPGVYATLGVSKWSSPFAIQAGASWAPALREISVDGETESRSAVRVGANVVVDVPLRR